MIERAIIDSSPPTHRAAGETITADGTAKVGSACQSLEVFGAWLGCGFVVLGVISCLERLLSLSVPASDLGKLNPTRSPLALVSVVYSMTWHCLAGLGAIVLSRLLAAVIAAHFEQSRSLRGRSEPVDRAVVALGRLGEVLQSTDASVETNRVSSGERERRMADIVQSIRSSSWDQATTLLADFALEYPDDSAHGTLTNELSTAKAEFLRKHHAELQAAQEVNDPERVLELYHAMMPCFETEERPRFDRELASWFLTVIHRRLRTGTIQVDVVNLATRFSESFATTAAGASVRAALPTLRRSAGLCPRCGQPYIGVADACAQCRTNAGG